MSKLLGIALNPKLFFQAQNLSFNSEVESLIDDLFTTNKITNEEYVIIGDYVFDQVLEFTPFSEKDKAIQSFNKTIRHEIIQTNSPIKKAYENLVAHLMLEGSYNTYVIAGGMGTGKSSACDYITSAIIQQMSKNGDFIINVKFDFNEPYEGNEDEVVELFKRQLFERLINEVETYILENPNSLEDFCKTLSDPNKKKKYSEFYNFKIYKTIDWEKNTLTIEQKLSLLIEYISNYEDKLIPLMKIVYFIAHNYENNIVIFVFDNIDILLPDYQRSIIRKIFKYNLIAEIKCFVPLRRATFKRALKDIQRDKFAKSTYNFGYIHHHGAEPIKIVLERTKVLIDNYKNNKLIKSVDITYQENILERLNAFKELLESDNSFSKFFSLIVGRSSRLALSISKRIFVNNVIEYTSHTFYPDMGIKAFMVKDNSSFLFDNVNEQEIANVFCHNKYGDFSFISYLILQYVHIATSIEEYEISYIYKKVKHCYKGNLDINKFVEALNYILSVRRPLIWSDDKSYYESDSNIIECENTLQFTELGRGYMEVVNRSTQYIQECLMSLRWKHDYIPQSFDSFKFVERFSFIRKCILEIFNQEKSNLNYDNTIKPVSTILFNTIGNYFNSIISRDAPGLNLTRKEYSEEYLNWKSLYIELFNEYGYKNYSYEKDEISWDSKD